MDNFQSPIGRPFLDKLLLAIIDAHPDPSLEGRTGAAMANREKRLDQARSALIGTNLEGRQKRHDDLILRWMGVQRLKQTYRLRQNWEKNKVYHEKMNPINKMQSIRSFAKFTCKHFKLDESEIERLRKRFAEQEKKWLDIARWHDDAEDMGEFNALTQISEILERGGVRMNVKPRIE